MQYNHDIEQKLLNIGLLTENDCQPLIEAEPSFKVTKCNESDKVIFYFNTKKPITKQLFVNIISNYYKNNYSNTDKKLCELIKLRFNQPPLIDENQLYGDLISIFLTINNQDKVLPNDFMNNFSFVIINQQLLVTYKSNSSKAFLQKIEESLIDFFAIVNLDIKEFDYVVNKQWKEDVANTISNQKQKQITINIDPNKEHLERAKILNKKNIDTFKTKITTIEQLEQYAIDIEYDDSFRAKIKGKIVRMGPAANAKKDKPRYDLTITDYQSAITLTAFVGIPENNSWANSTFNSYLPESYLKEFRVGDWVEVAIRCKKVNNVHHDVRSTLNAMTRIETPAKFNIVDDAKQKRVELMCHSKMTVCDSIMSIDEIVDRVNKFGWKAFGITDRSNVHVYGHIASKKINKILTTNGIKPLYGVELLLAKRKVGAIRNPINVQFDKTEYIIFDIETTGLNSEYDEITEIGAVRLKDGVIVDRFDQLIKINGKLSDFISKKTHITNEMLANQPPLKDVLIQFKKYIGDNVLVAHNGFNFDLRFLNKKLISCGLDIINNTCIDTMYVSRIINPKYKKHTLGYIATENSIVYSEDVAHRADADCEVLAKVWINMIDKMRTLKMLTFQDYNNSPQVASYVDSTFPPSIVVYAKNQQGIKKLYKLVSSALTTNFTNKPIIYVDDIERLRDDLIIVSHPTEGEVFDVCVNGLDEQLTQTINWYDYVFVCPPGCYDLQIQRGEITRKAYEEIVQKIITFAIQCKKQVIAVSDSYFLDEWDRNIYKIIINHKPIKKIPHRLYSYSQTNTFAPDLHLRTTNEMLNEFEFLQDKKLIHEIVVDNSIAFANNIDVLQPLKLKPHPPAIENVDNKLKECVYDNAKKIYGNNLPKIVADRIEEEIKLILNYGYSVIYWICHSLVAHMNKHGCSVGSRGSVGSSLVAFLSGISEVNPLKPHYYCKKCQHSDFNIDAQYADGFDLPLAKCPNCGGLLIGDGHDIPFETFLGLPTKPKTPDIDLNVGGEYQTMAHNFIRNEFGKNHTFRAGTISTMQQKKAYAEVRSYFEKNYPTTPITFGKIDWLSTYLEGCKITTGQHPGGIVIIPAKNEIEDFTPVNYPADEKPGLDSEDWKTTHFDIDSIHDTLLKFDVLGQDMPTMLEHLHQLTGVDLNTIPFDDQKTMSLFSSIEALKIRQEDLLEDSGLGTLGISEYGTDYAMRILKGCQPKTFADLVKVAGLSHGTGVWKDNAEDIIKNQHKTIKDVIACREDIISQLVSLWNVEKEFAFAISEVLRKGGGFDPAWEETLQSEKHLVPDWYINSCKKITYLFPKAHAVAYALMPWKMAWFKVYHPKEFYAAYFSIFAKEFDLLSMTSGPKGLKAKIVELNELKKQMQKQNESISKIDKVRDLEVCLRVALECWLRGIELKMIDINKSQATDFVIEDKAIYLPFIVVSGLGIEVAKSIIDARNEKKFISHDDFKQRTKINKNHYETLSVNHVLDHLPESSETSLF